MYLLTLLAFVAEFGCMQLRSHATIAPKGGPTEGWSWSSLLEKRRRTAQCVWSNQGDWNSGGCYNARVSNYNNLVPVVASTEQTLGSIIALAAAVDATTSAYLPQVNTLRTLVLAGNPVSNALLTGSNGEYGLYAQALSLYLAMNGLRSVASSLSSNNQYALGQASTALNGPVSTYSTAVNTAWNSLNSTVGNQLNSFVTNTNTNINRAYVNANTYLASAAASLTTAETIGRGLVSSTTNKQALISGAQTAGLAAANASLALLNATANELISVPAIKASIQNNYGSILSGFNTSTDPMVNSIESAEAGFNETLVANVMGSLQVSDAILRGNMSWYSASFDIAGFNSTVQLALNTVPGNISWQTQNLENWQQNQLQGVSDLSDSDSLTASYLAGNLSEALLGTDASLEALPATVAALTSKIEFTKREAIQALQNGSAASGNSLFDNLMSQINDATQQRNAMLNQVAAQKQQMDAVIAQLAAASGMSVSQFVDSLNQAQSALASMQAKLSAAAAKPAVDIQGAAVSMQSQLTKQAATLASAAGDSSASIASIAGQIASANSQIETLAQSQADAVVKAAGSAAQESANIGATLSNQLNTDVKISQQSVADVEALLTNSSQAMANIANLISNGGVQGGIAVTASQMATALNGVISSIETYMKQQLQPLTATLTAQGQQGLQKGPAVGTDMANKVDGLKAGLDTSISNLLSSSRTLQWQGVEKVVTQLTTAAAEATGHLSDTNEELLQSMLTQQKITEQQSQGIVGALQESVGDALTLTENKKLLTIGQLQTNSLNWATNQYNVIDDFHTDSGAIKSQLQSLSSTIEDLTADGTSMLSLGSKMDSFAKLLTSLPIDQTHLSNAVLEALQNVTNHIASANSSAVATLNTFAAQLPSQMAPLVAAVHSQIQESVDALSTVTGAPPSPPPYNISEAQSALSGLVNSVDSVMTELLNVGIDESESERTKTSGTELGPLSIMLGNVQYAYEEIAANETAMALLATAAASNSADLLGQSYLTAEAARQAAASLVANAQSDAAYNLQLSDSQNKQASVLSNQVAAETSESLGLLQSLASTAKAAADAENMVAQQDIFASNAYVNALLGNATSFIAAAQAKGAGEVGGLSSVDGNAIKEMIEQMSSLWGVYSGQSDRQLSIVSGIISSALEGLDTQTQQSINALSQKITSAGTTANLNNLEVGKQAQQIATYVTGIQGSVINLDSGSANINQLGIDAIAEVKEQIASLIAKRMEQAATDISYVNSALSTLDSDATAKLR